MAWGLLVLSVFVLWLASICKILHVSWFPSKVAFFRSGGFLGDISQKKTCLLVIAHPDDESMFFTPTITYLTSRGHNVHILCLSTGNADGMGDTRKQELFQACAILKGSDKFSRSYDLPMQVPLKQVVVLDHPELQDGFGKTWNHLLVAQIVGDAVKSQAIDSVLTFDNYGVSGHCNHRDVHFGIRKFVLDSQDNSIETWELVSANVLRKYSGPFDIWFSSYMARSHCSGEGLCLINEDPVKSFSAMAQHLSQWVWFRKLFVSFSSYTYVNTLRRIAI